MGGTRGTRERGGVGARRRTFICAAGAVMAAAVCSPVIAAPEGVRDDVLRGPSVGEDKEARAAEAAASLTIVRRDFAGKVERLDVSPAQAAVEAMELDAEARERVTAVLASRAAVMDGIVQERLNDLLALIGEIRSNDGRERLRALRGLTEIARPYLDRGPLEDELAGVLKEQDAATLRRVVAEYWSALAAEEEAGGGGRPGMDRRMDDAEDGGSSGRRARFAERRGRSEADRRVARVQRAETLRLLGREIGRSVDRTLGQAAAEFDEIIARLGLRPEQESRIRAMVQDFASETEYRASPEQQREVLTRLFRELDAEQRARLVEILRERRGM